MRILKRIFVTLIALFVLAVGVAFLLPNRAAASRSIVIDRPASMIFPMLDGFSRFNEWSPWFDLDPQTVYTYEGPAHGVGAKSLWKSDDPNVGQGSQTITRVVPDQRVETALDFGEMGQPRAYFNLEPQGGATRVTWGFEADLPITFDGKFLYGVMGRYFGLFMDGMIGADYEKGLAKLKKLMESMPNADIAGLEVTSQEVSAQPSYFISTEAGTDAASSSRVLGEAYGEIMAFLQANQIQATGSPYTLIHRHEADKWVFDAGITVDRNDVVPSGRIQAGSTPGGKILDFKHVGSYDLLGQTHAKAEAWMAVHGAKEMGKRMEIYVSDPSTVQADQVITLVRVGTM